MRQFGTLLRYEWKKICCRKSTWITFSVLLAAFLLSAALAWGSTHTITQDINEDTGEIIEEEWQESYAQKTAREKKNGLYWSGKTIDDALLEEVKKDYHEVLEKSETVETGRQKFLTEEMERFKPIEDTLGAITGDWYLSSQFYDDQKGKGKLTEEKIYEARDAQVQSFQKKYELTEKECSYWQEKEESLSKPFIMEYAEGFFQLISMNGLYMVFLFASFLLAVVVGRIFAEEHQRRLDQVILCSRFGRGQLYFAKITAGILFAFLQCL